MKHNVGDNLVYNWKDVSPRIVFVDIQCVCVQQQSTPGEEAVRGQHANVGTRVQFS